MFSFVCGSFVKNARLWTTAALRMSSGCGLTKVFHKKYEHANDLFLSTYPTGTIRKQVRRIDGINYRKKRKVKRAESKPKRILRAGLTGPQLRRGGRADSVCRQTDILSDEWSDSEDFYC